jgi:hypothetical protein
MGYPAQEAEPSGFGEFLRFRRMITPIIIEIIFWVGVVGCVLGGLVIAAQGGSKAVGGIFLLILGPLAVRVYCEILIVVFRMNENLTAIRQAARPAAAASAPSETA